MARPEPIHAHALENLRFIREAMSRASEFTAVPGWGGIFMGLTALVTAPVAGPPDNTSRWVLIWLADAMVARRLRWSPSRSSRSGRARRCRKPPRRSASRSRSCRRWSPASFSRRCS